MDPPVATTTTTKKPKKPKNHPIIIEPTSEAVIEQLRSAYKKRSKVVEKYTKNTNRKQNQQAKLSGPTPIPRRIKPRTKLYTKRPSIRFVDTKIDRSDTKIDRSYTTSVEYHVPGHR